MTLKIYGTARSRAIRTLWMAKELGMAFEHIDVEPGPASSHRPEFLTINPNGRVPTIDDDGLVLWESLAINLYLARRHGGDPAPANAEEDALITSWSFWAAIEVEQHAATVMWNTHLLPVPERKPEAVRGAIAKLQRPLAVLEAHLNGHSHLVGDRFTVADLNLVCCLFYLRFTPEVLAQFPRALAWYQAGLARPAARAAWALRGDWP